jgi:excisionase family DNA binding protein
VELLGHICLLTHQLRVNEVTNFTQLLFLKTLKMASIQILKELQEIKKLLLLQKDVLTLNEFCLYAGISKNQAYHLTSSGQVEFYRPFGKMIYFDKEEVIDFLKQNAVSGKERLAKQISKHFLPP